MLLRTLLLVTLCTGLTAGRSPAGELDGATIENSGSTNGLGWRIALLSNGQTTATTLARGQHVVAPAPTAAAPFSTEPSLVERFFSDVRAARDAGESPATCMKSASFGTRTIVTWHGWTSGDLSCPGNPPALAALARDVAQLQTAVRVTALPLYRRVPLRDDGTPAPSPPPSPERPASKDGTPARQSHRR